MQEFLLSIRKPTGIFLVGFSGFQSFVVELPLIPWKTLPLDAAALEKAGETFRRTLRRKQEG